MVRRIKETLPTSLVGIWFRRCRAKHSLCVVQGVTMDKSVMIAREQQAPAPILQRILHHILLLVYRKVESGTASLFAQ